MATIYFDMDGTIADLYGVSDWLNKLNDSDVTPYEEAKPLVDMEKFAKVCGDLVSAGYQLGVISWTAKGGSKEYNKEVRKAKKAWIEKHCPQLLNDFHCVKYGTPKHYVKKGILIDDNADVRASWDGISFDASNSEEMMEGLRQLAAA